MNARPFTDAELVALLPRLKRQAFGLTRAMDRAEDLVQSAMVRALAHSNQFQPGSNLAAWMSTILRNTYFNDMRALSRRPTVEIDDVVLPVKGNQEDTVYLGEICRRADALPVEMAQAIVLVGLDGADYEEAAAEAGIAVGTMKSRVSRARAALAGRGA